MSRVDDIISSIGNNGTEKKKSRVESIIENSSNGNLKTGVDNNYISSFAKDTNDFLSNFNNGLKDIGFNNASSYYDSFVSKSGELAKRAKTIQAYLNSNKNNLDEETYNSLMDSLNSFYRTRDSIVYQLGRTSQYYSQWDTEDEYKKYQKEQEEYDALLKFDTKTGAEELHLLESDLEGIKATENQIAKIKQEQQTLYLASSKGDKESHKKYKQNEEYLANMNRMLEDAYAKYGGKDGLESLISQKNQYLTLASRAQKAVELASVAENEDFEKNSKYIGLDVEDISTEEELLYMYINGNENVNSSKNDPKFESYRYINDDQKKIYNYYYNTGNKKMAQEYLDAIQETLNYQQAEAEFKSYEGKLLSELVFGISAGLDQFESGMEAWFSGEDYIPTSTTQYLSGMIREDLGDDGAKLPDWLGGSSLGQVGYDAITTTSNMLPSILTSAVVEAALPTAGEGGIVLSATMAKTIGKGVGAATLGASAGGSARAEMLRLGYSKEQANAYGVMVGAAEGSMEYLLGHIPGLSKGDGVFSTLATKAVSKVDNALARVAITIGGSLDEALEEGLQTIIEPWLKEAATGVDWDDPSIDEVLYSSLLGAITSAGFQVGAGAVNLGANAIHKNQQIKAHGQAIIDKGGVDTLKELALEMSGVSKQTTNLANKVGQNASAKNVGRLSAHLEESISKQNRTDIENALVEKGLSKKDAKRVTEYIVSTEALTEEQIAEIEGNENIKDTMTKLLIDPKSDINERGRNLLGARLGIDMKNAKVKANKSGELSLRNDIDVAEKVSETGKTTAVITDDKGKESSAEINIDKKNPIAKVKYVGDERIVYLNTDHGTVEASKVKYASKEEALLYESFVDMNPAFANAVIKNYDNSVPIQTYINGMREGMILYGMHNFQAVGKDISKNSFLASLSETDQIFALKLGRAYAKADAKKANNDLRTAIRNAAEKAKASEETSTSEAKQNKPKKGRVIFEEGAKEQTHKQHKKTLALAKVLASAIGIDIVIYDSTITKDKHGKGANGYYDEKTDTIHLDLQNAKDDAKTIAYTLSHELVHFIKKWSPQKFNTFAQFLMEQYASHGVSTSAILKKKMAELNTTDADFAYEEMIADACETMLLDSNAVVKLMELRKSDLELFEKIKLHIHKILNNIREAYKKLGYQPTSDEAKALLGMKDVLEQFYSLFEEAAVDATQKYQALGTEGYNEFVAKSTKNANETVFGEDSVEVGKTESGVKQQLKAHKTIGEASIAYNERHKKVHKAILQVGIESMYEMAETMLPYLEEEGILPPDIPGKTIFKNGSYGKTGENTTLCVRTLTYEDFKDRVAEKVGRPLTVSESLLVSQKIYDIATEPQCIYCYVAADRKAYDEYLGEYHKAMDKYIKAMRKGGDSKALYTEYLAGRKDTDAQKKRWSQWEAIAKSGKEYISASDLTTKRKRDEIIAKKNAFSDQIKDAQRYAQSASWAKTVCDYRAYKGDILKMTSAFVDILNSEYGLRMYSFSDYTPAFIVENMQMIIDASVKGLKSLAYTKDTDYVEIFASTGQAINVSCFAKWDAEKGTYVEDNRQGANWEKTKNLRKQYRNVGAVMVATNDAMVEWALKQDWVDVVIPYHIVKTGTTIANEYQWNNYTSESSDKSGNRAANIYPTEHNNDFSTYSDLLKERGITPRFSRWFDKVASGELTEEQYMKLVNEVRLPASELSPVVPSFNLDAAKKSFGIDNEGKVIKGGFVDKGGYMGGWYRQGVDVNQEVMAVSEDIKAGKSSLDVDYGMSKVGKERVEERYKKQEKSTKGNIHYSLKVKRTNGTESIVSPYDVTREETLEYLHMSRNRQLVDKTYFPIMKNTPPSFLAILRHNNIKVEDRPIAMQAVKARQSQIVGKPTYKNGVTIRYHALSPEEILEAIDNIDKPQDIIHEKNRTKTIPQDDGSEIIVPAPDSFAVFVKLKSGKKCVVVVQFDSDIESEFLLQDGNGDIYHTTVTVFEPDVMRGGFPFDYVEQLLEDENNDDLDLDITKENPNSEAAYGENLATASEKEFSDGIITQEKPSVKKQLKKTSSSQYAPTFYSQMGKVIDDIKMDKVGATSLVNYLKGKGIKHDEIKWSGIEAFLEGKKSVTKAELQEFVAGSQLEIAEEMSSMIPYDIIKDGDNYLVKHKNGLIIDTWEYTENPGDPELVGWMSEDTGDIVSSIEELYAYVSDSYDEIGTRWSQYRLEGGTNYRELVFKMPNSSYSNNAMRAHWGEDGEGILAHARIQDMTTSDGKKMLFIEEIQSDWHNEGSNKGYITKRTPAQEKAFNEKLNNITKQQEQAFQKLQSKIRSMSMQEALASEEIQALRKEERRLENERTAMLIESERGIPDAPFRDTYHEYVLKRLLRMAAEEGYDSIGWTPADIQSERWSALYAEGYRIEYDQDIPKFLRKYGKKWGATVGKSTLKGVETKEIYYDVNRREQYGSREAWEDEVKTNLVFQGMPARDVRYVKFKEEGDYLIAYGKDGTEYDRAEIQRSGDSVWSMDITESMEQSVLYEGQPKFQKKKLSNRTILANTLESAIDTSTQEGQNELKWLKDYQGKIALIEKEEAHLAEVNAEIKEISFTKGSDRSKLKDLNDDKTRTANRIHTYDRQLLRLEAMKPVKDVLAREKELVRKRTEEKGREALDAYREKMTKTQRELLSRYKDQAKAQRERTRETHDKGEAKDKLQKLILKTINWLKYPKKEDVKCPDMLKEPYKEFLESIDLSSKRLQKGGDPTKNDLRLASAMDSLATAIEKIKTAQNPNITTEQILDSGYLDLPENFVELLRTKAEDIKKMMISGNSVVNDMHSTDVKALTKLIRTLNHAIKEMSTLYANLRFANVQELGDNTISFHESIGEADSTNGVKDFVEWDNALPYYAFKRFGVGGESVFEGLMDAQDKLARLAEVIFDFKDKTWTDKEANEWGEDTHTIELPSGRTLTLTTADAMSIYCLSRRDNDHGMNHLLAGGVRVIGIKKGAKKASDSRSTLTQEDVIAITSSLTDRQRAVAEAIQSFMSSVCSDWGNEISMKRFLTKEFNEKFYFPIESNDENLDTKDPKAQQSDLYRLLNISATKPLTPGANNEVIIRNIFEVFTNHTSDMARLNSFGMALLDYMKWLNYREKSINEENGQITVRGVRKSMEVAYGEKAKSYVINLIKDINGRHNDNGDNSFLMSMMRMSKTASVGNNLRVAFLQFTSYPRATMILSTGSLAKGLTRVPQIEKAKKYCGIALWKSFGFYDTNIARSIEDQIKGTTNIRQKIIELSMKTPELADAITWGALWNACEYEVAKTTKNKVGSEEFYQEVGRKLREVVYATQVVDSVLTRSQIMRSKSGLTQIATAYMSEPTLTANILMDAGFQFQKEKRITGSAKTAWKKTGKIVGRAVANYCVLQLLTSLAESLADAWRDDDEEEFGEKFKEAFTENLITNIIPFNKLPIISDIAELILSRFGIGFVSSDNMATTWITQIADALDVWAEVLGEKFGGEETSKTIYNAINKTAKAISSVTGVSISGAMREVVALWNNTAGAYDFTLKIRTYELTNDELGNMLFDAIVEGDSEQTERVMGRFDNQDDANAAFRKVLKEKYQSGEVSRSEAIDLLINYGGYDEDFDEDDAYWRLEEWDFGIESEDDYSKYADFYEAVKTGKNIKAVIREYTDHGVEAKTLASQITKYYKPLYKEMSNAERARIKGYLLNAYELLGYDRSKKSKDIDKWLED